MGDNTNAKLLRHRRRSVRAIPIYVGFTAAAAVIVLFKPAWWSWTILGMTAFTLLGDIFNLWFSTRKSGLDRATEQDRP